MGKVYCYIYFFIIMQIYYYGIHRENVYSKSTYSIEFSAVSPIQQASIEKKGEPKEYLKQYHSNGVLKKYTPMHNGIIDGIEKEFFANGLLYKESHYVGGLLHGKVKE